MRALMMLVAGQVLVVLDLRLDGLDVVPDPVGWALTALALLLLERHAAFVVGAVAAGVGAVLSAPTMLDPTALGPLQQVESWLQTAVVFATCTGVMTRRPARRRTAQVLRWANLGVLLAFEVVSRGAVLTGLLPPSGDLTRWELGGGAAVLVAVVAVLLVLVVLVAYGWFLVWCVRVARGDGAGSSRPEGRVAAA